MIKNTIIRLGLLFVLAGFFIPLVLLPFSTNYHPKAGLLHNIQMMEVPLLEKKRKPEFQPLMEKSVGSIPVTVGDTDIVVEFSESTPITEMEQVMDAAFPRTKKVQSSQYPKRMKFDRWQTVREEMVMPYKYPFAVGILLVFTGIAVVILSVNKEHENRE